MPRKVSSLFNINSLHPFTYFIFTAAAALPAPIELFSPAVFKVGDIVHSIPDTAPGVDPALSVTITGAVIELKVEGGWRYNISSIHDPRNTLWVPEHRVRLISKSIFDDAYIEVKAAYDANKAAKEANRVRMQQRNLRAKEGKLRLQY